MKHKNSQKRIYFNGAVYFITFNTLKNFPYFDEDILCRLFIKELNFCQKYQHFEIIAYKINPEHIHLLIKPKGKYNYSQIMGAIKRNFARDANRLISPVNSHDVEGDDPDRRLQHHGTRHHQPENFIKYRKRIDKFIKSHKPHFQKINLPKFKWQKSFHDHYIRDEIDFFNHVAYIKRQHIKHNLSANKWVYVSNSFFR
ncbi:MAG: transposase [Spirochaetia bacterium]|nr:transposase [Spirochaetia bacterium]